MELAIIIFLLIIIGVLFILNRKNSVATDIPLPYHKKFLLTKNEWSFYKNLKKDYRPIWFTYIGQSSCSRSG